MDVLSDLISVLDVNAMVTARLEAHGPWAMSFTASAGMKFAGVLEGGFWLSLEHGVPTWIAPGDFYLLPHGLAYVVATEPGLAPADGRAVLTACRDDDGIVRYNSRGHGARCVGIGGRFVFDPGARNLLLACLPPLIHIPAASAQAAALRPLLDLLRIETERSLAGGDAIAAGLGRMVLVHILRAHLASATQPAGWLGALADPGIGAGLQAMHADVRRKWTLQMLAERAGMSRTVFCERFRRLAGMPPLGYLAAWRMALARKALCKDGQSLTRIAVSIGYDSDTAFGIAFRRHHGTSPGRYRTRALAGPGG